MNETRSADFCYSIDGGSAFEKQIGYARVKVVGNWVLVSGTTGYDYSSQTIAPSLIEQTQACLANIEQALHRAGCTLKDVVRAHYYLLQGEDFDSCVDALRTAFSAARPAATMVYVAALIDPRVKIEIEVSAYRAAASA